MRESFWRSQIQVLTVHCHLLAYDLEVTLSMFLSLLGPSYHIFKTELIPLILQTKKQRTHAKWQDHKLVGSRQGLNFSHFSWEGFPVGSHGDLVSSLFLFYKFRNKRKNLSHASQLISAKVSSLNQGPLISNIMSLLPLYGCSQVGLCYRPKGCCWGPISWIFEERISSFWPFQLFESH